MKIKKIVIGPLLTNCYILIEKNEALVIDPGGNPQSIFDILKNKKLKFIILTHYHFDHLLGVLALRKKTGAFILAGEKEKEFIKNLQVDKFLEEGANLKIDKQVISVIETPGHSKGSISLLYQNFIFVGDCVFANGVGRTDLPGGSLEDLKHSLIKLKKIIKSENKICPGHGRTFSGKEFLKIFKNNFHK